jgi:hypothetical protein
MTTFQEACRQGVEMLARAAAKSAALPPEEAARRAWYPGGPSLEDLTADIKARRAKHAA